MPTIEIRGSQFGVRFVPRGPNDNHACLQLLSEDDEQWSKMGSYWSSFWIDDLIQVLTLARRELNGMPKDGKWGRKLRAHQMP